MEKAKILVEVYDHTGLVKKKKYPINGHKIIFKKGRVGKGGAEQSATFTPEDVIPYRKGILKRLNLKLIYNSIAKKFINPRAKVPVDCVLTWDQIARFFQANVVKAAGSVTAKTEIPLFLWVLLGANLLFTFLILIGVRFG